MNEPGESTLTFGFHGCNAMYLCHGDLDRDGIWDEGKIAPYGEVSLPPTAGVLSYGLGVFEGLKARRCRDGRVLVFRPDANARRMQDSAARIMLPPFPQEQFLSAIDDVVRANSDLIPKFGQGAFYLRPLQHAIEPMLGLRPSRRCRVIIYGSPVGNYFEHAADEGLRLCVVDRSRGGRGGTAGAKVIGNYAGGIPIADQHRKLGFDDVVYLDAADRGFVSETSGSNVFARLSGGTLVTPALDDQVLPGITRDSTLQLAREFLDDPVEERELPLELLLEDAVEVFCTGTAWTLRSVGEIVHGDKTRRYTARSTQRELLGRLRAIQRGEVEDRFGWTREIS